ncbi:MAG: hypothetical protein AUG51_20260 [Acidobacteria bacterium 13_1_20CM_3_53_8]|nr:MAG: hypothetical protein AUG51_20260 [Acidobacteria bacterium 13_1_20CM_3_53_8]
MKSASGHESLQRIKACAHFWNQQADCNGSHGKASTQSVNFFLNPFGCCSKPGASKETGEPRYDSPAISNGLSSN